MAHRLPEQAYTIVMVLMVAIKILICDSCKILQYSNNFTKSWNLMSHCVCVYIYVCKFWLILAMIKIIIIWSGLRLWLITIEALYKQTLNLLVFNWKNRYSCDSCEKIVFVYEQGEHLSLTFLTWK